MEPGLVVVIALVLTLPLLVVYSYNRFVAQRASMDAAWAGIDVELQRRHDLVPNLVHSVQGYAAHERQLLERVVEARNRAVAAVPEDVTVSEQARAEDALTERLTGLLALSEAYPQLRADRVFLDLQRELVDTEDRISASRRLYNLEVAAYERRRQAFPSNLVASGFGFEPRPLFEILDAAARHAPHVAS
ncbi:LemA family protein [Egicoccus halophilus]|uniref:Membrane protein n=1 Tax=Egicoccus halophilus TaxID=1670830 RepID=A0A8J3A9E4_9ACTN|nr:LemA family protein [Egicoccus halophilus]GGI07441.1 membrane protein [Egicoccus halophilus]